MFCVLITINLLLPCPLYSVPYGFPLIFREAFEIPVFLSSKNQSILPPLLGRDFQGRASPCPKGKSQGRGELTTELSLLGESLPKLIVKTVDFVLEENCFASQFLLKSFIPELSEIKCF